MTATLTPPPPPQVAARIPGSRVANRAVARWARRLLRREWRQQVLIISLLAVAVAATTVGLGLVVNVASSDQALLGSARTRVDVNSPRNPTALIASARRAFGTIEVIEDAHIPVPGSTTSVDLRAMDQHGHFSSPMLRIVSGHFPGVGEVAVTKSVLATFSLHVGREWTVLRQTRRVVGIVENPDDLNDAFALVAPGQISAPSSVSLLTDASGDSAGNLHTSSGEIVGIMSDGTSAAQRKQQQALAVLLVATIGLTFIGLLSVAGFTVMAHRRLRSLGMIGAIGATGRQVRKVMLANGTAVGVVGAAAGVVIGLGAWFAFRPGFESIVGHRIELTSMPWWAVGFGAVLAVLASVAASWWPAQSVSRMPVVAALSGRPPAPQPARRFALVGVALAAIGFVLLARNSGSVVIVLGILATTAGMLLLAPLGIQLLALLARRSPVAVRLALRDLARYQARSGAALAAASLAVGIAATIAITAAAQQANDRSYSVGNLPKNQLIVWLDQGDSGPGAGPPVGGKVARPTPGPSGPTAAQIASSRSTAASIAAAVHAAAPVELDVPYNPRVDASHSAPGFAAIAKQIFERGRHGFNVVDQPYLATPALLRLYGLRASDLHGDIVTSRTDLAHTKVFDGVKDNLHAVTIQVQKKVSSYTSAPDALMTQRAATSLGLVARPTGFLIQTRGALTAAQIRAARKAAAAAGVVVETRRATGTSLQRLREYATLTGLLVALAVLAMTVGLIRSETSGDLRTLTAAGASGRLRRMLTATTAAALGLLGGVIGVAGAYLALIAWHWGDLGYLSQPPYLEIGALVVALPLAGLAGGWLAGRTPSHLSRVRIE